MVTLSEIVAYDVTGLRLKRRWSFSFPQFGDSGKALACAPNGTVLALRAKYSESDFINDVAFLPYSRILAIAGSDRTPSEPVTLWAGSNRSSHRS